jgi:hypothetical protein
MPGISTVKDYSHQVNGTEINSFNLHEKLYAVAILKSVSGRVLGFNFKMLDFHNRIVL